MRAGQEHVGRAAGKEKEKTIKMLSILTVTWLKKEILQYNRPKETQDVERKAGLQPFAYLFINTHWRKIMHKKVYFYHIPLPGPKGFFYPGHHTQRPWL